jgi:hypothetical protein
MADEIKEDSTLENAGTWSVCFSTNNGVKSYITVCMKQLKDAVKAAREKGDNTPTLPVEHWVLSVAFQKAEEMMSKVSGGVKLMYVDMEPKKFKVGV